MNFYGELLMEQKRQQLADIKKVGRMVPDVPKRMRDKTAQTLDARAHSPPCRTRLLRSLLHLGAGARGGRRCARAVQRAHFLYVFLHEALPGPCARACVVCLPELCWLLLLIALACAHVSALLLCPARARRATASAMCGGGRGSSICSPSTKSRCPCIWACIGS